MLLAEAGYPVSASQADTKWKNLTRRYREVIDHNNTSGNDKKTYPFYDELSDIYGYRPNVNPAATTSSMSISDSTISKQKTQDDDIWLNIALRPISSSMAVSGRMMIMMMR